MDNNQLSANVIAGPL